MNRIVVVVAVLAAALAITGCSRATGTEKLNEARYQIACEEAGGKFFSHTRYDQLGVGGAACEFEYPNLPGGFEEQP